MNKFKPWKKLPIWLAVSAVIIIAGVILMAVLGFNTAAERPKNTQFEVKYNVVVDIDEKKQDKLEGFCEDVFKSNGLSVSDMRKATSVAISNESAQPYTASFVFYFTSEVSAETQAKVEADLQTKIKADADLSGEYTVYTVWHSESVISTANYVWRGAVAVGIVVALVYVAIRFGVGSALTGLTLAVHDALFTLALLAITRIPVYAAAPVWFAATAALLSLVLWLFHCMKLRSVKKESQVPVDAETAVETAYAGVWKKIAVCAGIVAAVILLTGALATPGVRAAVLPLLVAVVGPVYSSLLFGPALHVHVKGAFDKLSRRGRPKYVGKEKQADK